MNIQYPHARTQRFEMHLMHPTLKAMNINHEVKICANEHKNLSIDEHISIHAVCMCLENKAKSGGCYFQNDFVKSSKVTQKQNKTERYLTLK